jgi:hypothetical protein
MCDDSVFVVILYPFESQYNCSDWASEEKESEAILYSLLEKESRVEHCSSKNERDAVLNSLIESKNIHINSLIERVRTYLEYGLTLY